MGLPFDHWCSSHAARDCLRCAGELKFVAYRRGDQNPFEQVRQDVLQTDENEVVQRRGVGDDDH